MSETLDDARPPTPVGHDECWLPRSRRSPGLARGLLRELLAKVQGGERYCDVGELLLTELVTNAVLHAKVPGRLIWVGLKADETELRIDVHDASGELAPNPRLDSSPDDESGRGLLLVEALSTTWGVSSRVGGIGKCVWVTVAAKDAGVGVAGAGEG